ncbi:AP2/ERF and B3 domain-containing transcription repressor RAV2-like [Nymphaea colorata]|nr:AP2/ERF and B3 domain-containing transcription repressor RAV2-like [Nymphaea colorata]
MRGPKKPRKLAVSEPDSAALCSATGKLPSSRYKGVVPQPNGRWGAQIYERHQRIWLGTFQTETEAARTYDIAALKFRGKDAAVNILSVSGQNETEAWFLDSHSKAVIVDMLRKNTYDDELSMAKASRVDGRTPSRARRDGLAMNGEREELFEKVLTPSDVGKLNRLVVPKQHAEKYFSASAGRRHEAMLLNFEDEGGRVWRFRYSYWNSSQSYVLTKGWCRFVKEKNLKAGDVVTFGKSKGPERINFVGWRHGVMRANAHPAQPPWDCTIRPPQRPAKLVRLFGVDLPRTTDAPGGGCGESIVGLEMVRSSRYHDQSC